MAKQSKSQGHDELLTRAETEIIAQLEACRVAREDSGYDRDLASSAASLGRSLASVLAEKRQQEKHARQMVERMTPGERDALVKEYVRVLAPERRAEFRQLLNELDGDTLL